MFLRNWTIVSLKIQNFFLIFLKKKLIKNFRLVVWTADGRVFFAQKNEFSQYFLFGKRPATSWNDRKVDAALSKKPEASVINRQHLDENDLAILNTINNDISKFHFNRTRPIGFIRTDSSNIEVNVEHNYEFQITTMEFKNYFVVLGYHLASQSTKFGVNFYRKKTKTLQFYPMLLRKNVPFHSKSFRIVVFVRQNNEIMSISGKFKVLTLNLYNYQILKSFICL